MGVVIGYAMMAVIVQSNYDWRWSIYIQCLGFVPCFLFFMITPEKYLDIEACVALRKQQEAYLKRQQNTSQGPASGAPSRRKLSEEHSREIYDNFGMSGANSRDIDARKILLNG